MVQDAIMRLGNDAFFILTLGHAFSLLLSNRQYAKLLVTKSI